MAHNPNDYFAEMDRAGQMAGMVITTARPGNPELQGWTPHIPSQPRLNAYLDLFNDADLAAQRATAMQPTREWTVNVGIPLSWHFEPPEEHDGLGGLEMTFAGEPEPSSAVSARVTVPMMPPPVPSDRVAVTPPPGYEPPPSASESPGFPWWLLGVAAIGYWVMRR